MKNRRIDRYYKTYRRPLIVGRYRCYLCLGVFDKGWTDEEAKAEAAVNFPGHVPQEEDLVCEHCFRKLGLYNATRFDKKDRRQAPDSIESFERDLLVALGLPPSFFAL